jgi:integrase
VSPAGALLSSERFQSLADVPPEAQWFANLDSAQTRRAYKNDLQAFMTFIGIVRPEEFRSVTRGHILAWRADLEEQKLGGATIRRKLAALASLYEYLCESNAVTHNPVKGVKRPKVESYEGKTPALGDAQARLLLDAPPADTLKGKRDRAILSVLLYHALRREVLHQALGEGLQPGAPRRSPSARARQRREVAVHPHSLQHPAPSQRILGSCRPWDRPRRPTVSSHR